MMRFAAEKFKNANIRNVTCLQGDVGAIPFPDHRFDVVLSMNGFHAFPDKEVAFYEIARVLRPEGTFIGCFYIKDETKRTDWFIDHFYRPKGYFTPPFMAKIELEHKLMTMYQIVEIWNKGSIVCFWCKKGEK